MTIKAFKELKLNDFKILSDIDFNAVDKYGQKFANQKWTEENFKYKLVNKYEYSFVFFEDKKVIGYIVSSQKYSSIYIHRFVVTKKGMAKSYFSEVLKIYEDKPIFLMVNIENNVAIKFYELFNFQIVKDGDLIRKYISNELKVKDTIIIIERDYKCYLMKRN